MVDRPLLEIIPIISLVLVSNYTGQLERKAEVDKRIKIIGWICFVVTAIIGLVLIPLFPHCFQN